MLAQAIVGAAKTVPEQRVTSAYMIFAKSAAFDSTLEVDVEVLRGGRTFSTVEVKISQDDKLRSAGMLLLDAGAPDVIRSEIPMPDVGGPADADEMSTFRVTGRDIRVIDGAYNGDPDLIGSPEIYAWCRFRDAPKEPYLHTALLAQSTTHWTIAAAMRPHQGFGEDIAHSTLSTGVMSIAMAFHEEVDVTQWLLYANPADLCGKRPDAGRGPRLHRGRSPGRDVHVASDDPGVPARPVRDGSRLVQRDVTERAQRFAYSKAMIDRACSWASYSAIVWGHWVTMRPDRPR